MEVNVLKFDLFYLNGEYRKIYNLVFPNTYKDLEDVEKKVFLSFIKDIFNELNK